MQIELGSSADAAIIEAVRRAVEATGLGERRPAVEAWRAAALAEGVGGDPVTRLTSRGSQARSPRSTLGATRA